MRGDCNAYNSYRNGFFFGGLKHWQIYSDINKQGTHTKAHSNSNPFNCGSKINLTISFYFVANDSINKRMTICRTQVSHFSPPLNGTRVIKN